MPAVPASHEDLLDVPYATLATLDAAGRPQLSQIAFLAEDGVVRISLNETRAKTRNLLRNPEANVLILDPQNPGRYLEIAGEAEVVPDDDLSFVARAGEKYGQDFRRHDGPGERRYAVTIHPRRVYAADVFG
ncbi:MAG: PPOX class F420-dependent oxidoreductase [Thermoleophilia bacterium]